MSNIRQFRSFSAEIIKYAAKIQDADIQSLLAERKGEEYLEGGRLLSNTAAEAQYVPKMAFDASTQAGLAASGTHNMHARKKKNNSYQSIRDYGSSALKGGLTAMGALGAVNMMKGKFGPPENMASAAKKARNWFGTGAGISIADRAYRYDDYPGAEKKATAVSISGPGSLKSPASRLAQARQTGGFKSRMIHKAGKPPRVLQIGKKFLAR